MLKLKCTKFDFDWGSAPDHDGEAYSGPPTPQLDLREPTSEGKEGRKDRRERQGRGEW